MKPDGLSLFWSVPPKGQRSRPDLRRKAIGDWLNLELAEVSGVMLPLWLAWEHKWIVTELADAGRQVILRVLDENLSLAASDVGALRKLCSVELVIIRNEPDGAYDLTWGAIGATSRAGRQRRSAMTWSGL